MASATAPALVVVLPSGGGRVEGRGAGCRVEVRGIEPVGPSVWTPPPAIVEVAAAEEERAGAELLRRSGSGMDGAGEEAKGRAGEVMGDRGFEGAATAAAGVGRDSTPAPAPDASPGPGRLLRLGSRWAGVGLAARMAAVAASARMRAVAAAAAAPTAASVAALTTGSERKEEAEEEEARRVGEPPASTAALAAAEDSAELADIKAGSRDRREAYPALRAGCTVEGVGDTP